MGREIRNRAFDAFERITVLRTAAQFACRLVGPTPAEGQICGIAGSGEFCRSCVLAELCSGFVSKAHRVTRDPRSASAGQPSAGP